MIGRVTACLVLLASGSAFAEEETSSEPIGSELGAGVAGGLVGAGAGVLGGVAIGKAFCGDSLSCVGFAVVGLGIGATVGAGGGIAYGGNHNGRTGSYAAAIGGTALGAGAGIGLTVATILATEDHDHPDEHVIAIGLGGTALTVLAGYAGGLLGYHLSSSAVTAMPVPQGAGLGISGTF